MRKEAAAPATEATTKLKQRQHITHPPLIEAGVMLLILIILTVSGGLWG